ncbi:MAG TPA: hypothetical protein VEW66_00270, partial [Thermomicrobiales bacterium]|nr:hypothetical protein [Thermomicrobiales bacterium]
NIPIPVVANDYRNVSTALHQPYSDNGRTGITPKMYSNQAHGFARARVEDGQKVLENAPIR